MRSDDVVDVRGISKSFGRDKVLDNISFNIKMGEIVCILGSSGKGKSVLIKVLAGSLLMLNCLVIPSVILVNVLIPLPWMPHIF